MGTGASTVRDHYFAPGIFAEDVRWIARRARRTRDDACPDEPAEDASVALSTSGGIGHDDMKSKPKPKRTAVQGAAKTRRGPAPSARRFKRPPLVWEPVVPAVKFRRDGPWELGSGLE